MSPARALEVNGIELSFLDTPAEVPANGDPPVSAILLHETGETAKSWTPLIEAIDGRMRTIAYDRRGWGGSGAPDHYTRTTVAEQARDALALLDELRVEAAVFCGCGMGALAALDAAVREPARVVAVAAVEPPLSYLLPDVTEGMSADVEALTAAAEAGGIKAAAELYASGGLACLGPGAERAALRCDDGIPAVRSPLSLFAEIAAIPGWSISSREIAEIALPVALVTGSGSPAVTKRAVDAALERARRMHRIELSGDPLCDPQLADVLIGFTSP